MKLLFNVSFMVAIVAFIAAVVTRIFDLTPWGYTPGAILRFANTTLLFAIVVILRVYLPAKE